ncbi:hypothetical protein [Nostoc sp.]|uniref:hypothetical protein n=1 Tax=Nostoc sp. TaxID=1180 RepID=UPI002FF4645E
MTSNTTTDIQMQKWTQAFTDKLESSFADAFADNVTLEASVLVHPIKGRDCVKSVMATASKVYEALTFTRQVESAQQTYLEWDAKAFGGKPLSGVTILIKNSDGQLSILLSIIVASVQCSASRLRCANVLRARSSRTISTKDRG